MAGMEDLLLLSAAVIVITAEKKIKKRRTWIRPYLNRRENHVTLSSELILDNYLFKNFTRMSKSDFEYLLQKIGPVIAKRNTVMRKSIPITTRLAITLRYLATGDSYMSLMYLFRVSDSSISSIVREVSQALIQGLSEYIELPSCQEKWTEIAKNFEDLWNFPHCLGAMDGKHVAVVCPPNSGSKYINYKNFFSVVLFAVVDANLKFMYAHVGCQGRISDGGVFRNTLFGKSLLNNTLNLPNPEPLPGREKCSPYVFVADDAFPLAINITKPYTLDIKTGSPKRIFNYRICRARRIVENAFGILSSVFRVLRKKIEVQIEHVPKVVLACVHLHNFLMRNKTSQDLYSPPGTLDCEDVDMGTLLPGSWRCELAMTNLQQVGRKASLAAKEVRDEFMNYFMTDEGRVPWQDKYLN